MRQHKEGQVRTVPQKTCGFKRTGSRTGFEKLGQRSFFENTFKFETTGFVIPETVFLSSKRLAEVHPGGTPVSSMSEADEAVHTTTVGERKTIGFF